MMPRPLELLAVFVAILSFAGAVTEFYLAALAGTDRPPPRGVFLFAVFLCALLALHFNGG